MKQILAAACLACLCTAPAWSAQYQLMVYESPAELAKRSDPGPAGQAYWQAFAAYGDALKAAGILRGGAALQAGKDARTVTAAAGKPAVAPGPAAASRAELGGWFLIEVAQSEDAIAWAAKAPSAQSGGAVEVRPVYIVPGMAPHQLPR